MLSIFFEIVRIYINSEFFENFFECLIQNHDFFLEVKNNHISFSLCIYNLLFANTNIQRCLWIFLLAKLNGHAHDDHVFNWFFFCGQGLTKVKIVKKDISVNKKYLISVNNFFSIFLINYYSCFLLKVSFFLFQILEKKLSKRFFLV